MRGPLVLRDHAVSPGTRQVSGYTYGTDGMKPPQVHQVITRKTYKASVHVCERRLFWS